MNLTNEMREQTIQKCINHVFKDRDQNLIKARKKIAEEIYSHIYKKDEAIAAKLPAGWCHTCTKISIQHAGLTWDGEKRGLPSSDFALEKTHLRPSIFGSIKADDYPDFIPDIEAVIAEHHAIVDGKQELRTSLVAILYACTTLAKLKDAWPEGASFFPEEKPRQLAVVPVNAVSKANSLMALR